MPRNKQAMLQRANAILAMLAQQEYLSIDALAAALHVSKVTLRKDLTLLEKKGVLRRTHGGAVPTRLASSLHPLTNQSFHENETRFPEEKWAIGLAAAELVAPGDTIAFTGGTTAMQVARSLAGKHDLTVVTNALNIALEAGKLPRATVFVPGGFLGEMYSLASVTALEIIHGLHIDLMFVGVNGIHAKQGVTELMNDQASIHRALLEQSQRRVVLADHSKLGRIYKAHLCSVSEIHILITDFNADPNRVEEFRQAGLQVIIAQALKR